MAITPPGESVQTAFDFLKFPGEVRNKIYSFAWIAARDRSPIYDIPDFVIFNGTPRWKNITTLYQTRPGRQIFALLLVCSQVYQEVRPMIWTEFQPYIGMLMPPPSSWTLYSKLATIEKASEICKLVRRITIDVGVKFLESPDHELDEAYEHQPLMLDVLAVELRKFKRLKEIVVKVPLNEVSEPAVVIAPLYKLARAGVALIVDLHHSFRGYDAEEEESEIEDAIWEAARQHRARKAEIWIEWTEVGPIRPHERA